MTTKRNRTLWLLYSALFFFSFHIYFLLYIQSSFINQFIAESNLILVYGTSALITAFLYLTAPKILQKYLDSKLALALILLEAVFCSIIAFTSNPIIIITAFILQQAIIPIIFFTLDILLEHNSKNTDTGHIRGRAFTAGNLALIFSPIAAGYIGNISGLQGVYPIALLFLVPLVWILYRVEKTDTELVVHHTSIMHAIQTLWSAKQRPIRLIFMVSLILHIFYAWMVIYSPIYLQHQGFNWDQIGIILSIMLLPFLLCSIPLGNLADSSFGHKKILIIGVVIMGAATLLFAYTQSTILLVWALILFMTRLGAVCIEVTSEIYFFKQISTHDVYTLSLFRLNRPLAHIGGPLLASLAIVLIGESMSYVVLSFIIFFALRYILVLPEKTVVAAPEAIANLEHKS